MGKHKQSLMYNIGLSGCRYNQADESSINYKGVGNVCKTWFPGLQPEQT